MSFQNLFNALATLPVAAIAEDVAMSVLSGKVTILSSATGSGKTLFMSSLLAHVNDDPVTVLVPRRFLAQNAAETVAELVGCEVGGLVGYAVGSQSGDKSFYCDETKLLFVTTGYAIASGLINRLTMVVFDEVHETTMDLSIARALIHRRMTLGEHVQVLEMSATMDVARQAAYWQGVAEVSPFEIDGTTFSCEQRHRPAGNIADEVIELVREGRKGILVFRPGKGEVEETAEKITQLAQASGLSVDISQIYGEMDYSERSAATRVAEGVSKILIGTNVMESGVNFPWADAGVTCGTGKENTVRPITGATYLELVDLPQWRLDQQEGRVKRFRDGIFVLCSPTAHEERPKETRPEIERLALTELVLHCAGFGLRTDELVFDYAPDADKVLEAEQKLQRLGLIDSDCNLTDAGRMVTDLPVGPETGAMLWHAMQIDCLPQMIALAAVIEVGGLRKSFRFGHGLDRESDHFDGMRALGKALSAHKRERKDVLERTNILYKRFQAAREMGRTLEKKLECEASFDIDSVVKQLRQCVFAGSLDKIYVGTFYADKVNSIKNRFLSYGIGNNCCCTHVDGSWLVVGDLRTITPRNGNPPFTVLEKITVGTLDDVLAVAKVRPEILTTEPLPPLGDGEERVLHKLFGEYQLPTPEPKRQETVDWGDDFDDDRIVRDDYFPFSSRAGRYRDPWTW